MNIGIYIIAILGGLLGGLATLFIVFSAPVVIIWKIYRKIRYNISIMD